jgi:hypothetical protein
MLVAVVLVCAVAFIAMAWKSSQFEQQYASFYEAEMRYEDAAIKPGAEENPIRQQVNILLAQVLQVEMSTTERLEKTRQGIAHLNDMETQIDAIKVEGDTVKPLIVQLEKAARSPGNIRNRATMLEIVSIAKRQNEIIADIRGLSYRTDYYTTEVFERIIDDQGEMTDEHTQYLNDLIPQLEEQFNKRSNLYQELGQNSEKLKDIARTLGTSAQ